MPWQSRVSSHNLAFRVRAVVCSEDNLRLLLEIISIFFFIQGNVENLDKHIKSSIGSHLDMMNYSIHEQNKKNKEMEEKFSHLENEKRALEQQLQNQSEELAAARQAQTQMSVVSSQMEEIINAIIRQDEKVKSLQYQLAHLKISAA